MPRPALSGEQVNAYRQRLAAVASRLFARHGFEAVTMRRIATELGESPMTPYRYFLNKADIFATVRCEAYRLFADSQTAAYDSTRDPRGRLLALREAYVDFALSNPDSYRVMFELKQDREEEYPELAAQSRRAFDCLHAAVSDAVSAGILAGDPVILAHALWAQVHGLVTLHLAGKLKRNVSFDALRAVTRVAFTDTA